MNHAVLLTWPDVARMYGMTVNEAIKYLATEHKYEGELRFYNTQNHNRRSWDMAFVTHNKTSRVVSVELVQGYANNYTECVKIYYTKDKKREIKKPIVYGPDR